MKDTTSTDKCRLCNEHTENTEHIISGCKVLAPKEYTQRHDNVAKIVHQQICKTYTSIQQSVPYYKYTPENIIETPSCKIYWNRTILTDVTIQHNRPDIVLKDKETKTTYLIDIAVPTVSNLQKKYTEKITKYLPLAEEVKTMWKQNKVDIVPLIIGATGEILILLKPNLKKINVKENTFIPMQKSVILGTCGIMRKVINNNNITI